MENMLKNIGIASKSITSNEDIENIVKQASFDIILIDFNMPKHNGLEVFSMIKPFISPNTKTIMISSNTTDINTTKALGHGFDACLFKPIKQIDLYNALAQLYGLQKKTSKQETDFIEKYKLDIPPDFKILLVEDNLINQKVAISVFKQLHLSADVANHGKEALEKMKETRYDLVFMDVQMPVMDGFETIKHLRTKGDNTIVIAMTANAMKGDREKCLAAGATDYIPKPIDSKEFIEKVKYYLNAKK